MIRSWSLRLRAVPAVAVLTALAFGVATPLVAAPSILDGGIAIDVAAPHEVWGAGKKWWHCALSLAFAGLASGFAGPAGSQSIVVAAVVGCMG